LKFVEVDHRINKEGFWN